MSYGNKRTNSSVRCRSAYNLTLYIQHISKRTAEIYKHINIQCLNPQYCSIAYHLTAMQTAHVIRLLQIMGNLQTCSIKYSRVTSIKKSFRLPLSQPVIRFFFFDFLSHGRSMLYRAWQLNSFSGIMNALRRNRR